MLSQQDSGLAPSTLPAFLGHSLSGEEVVWTTGYDRAGGAHVTDPLLCTLEPRMAIQQTFRLSCLDRCPTVRRYFLLRNLTLKNGKCRKFYANFTPINN